MTLGRLNHYLGIDTRVSGCPRVNRWTVKGWINIIFGWQVNNPGLWNKKGRDVSYDYILPP